MIPNGFGGRWYSGCNSLLLVLFHQESLYNVVIFNQIFIRNFCPIIRTRIRIPDPDPGPVDPEYSEKFLIIYCYWFVNLRY